MGIKTNLKDEMEIAVPKSTQTRFVRIPTLAIPVFLTRLLYHT